MLQASPVWLQVQLQGERGGRDVNCSGITYHSELGLYVDFQGLQLTSQLCNLLVA